MADDKQGVSSPPDRIKLTQGGVSWVPDSMYWVEANPLMEGSFVYLLSTPAREVAEEMERALEEIASCDCFHFEEYKDPDKFIPCGICPSCIARTALAARGGE